MIHPSETDSGFGQLDRVGRIGPGYAVTLTKCNFIGPEEK